MKPNRFGVRAAVVLLAAVLLCVLVPGVAFAATSYTNPLPAPNSATAVTKPPIKCTVTDPAGVNTRA